MMHSGTHSFFSPFSLHLQVLSLLHFLVVENQQKLKAAISRLEPFPDLPEFRELRSVQHALKYNTGAFTLRQVTRHPSIVCLPDSSPTEGGNENDQS